MKYEKCVNSCFFVKMFPPPPGGLQAIWSIGLWIDIAVGMWVTGGGFFERKEEKKKIDSRRKCLLLSMSVSVCFLKQGEHLHTYMRICLASPRLRMGRRSLCLEGRDNNTWNTPPGLKWEDLRQACLVGTQSKNYIRKLVTLSREVGGID